VVLKVVLVAVGEPRSFCYSRAPLPIMMVPAHLLLMYLPLLLVLLAIELNGCPHLDGPLISAPSLSL
jgi:hypothetical protein